MRGGADTRRAGERLRWCERKALEHAAKAAALLTDTSPEAKALAIIHLSAALLNVAESDPKERALDLAAQEMATHT